MAWRRRAAVTLGVISVCAAAGGCTPPSYVWSFDLVSVNATGTDSGDAGSGLARPDFGPPVVASADGRRIAFLSNASNLGPADTGSPADTDLYVRDLQTGATTLVSVNHAGTDSSTGDVSTFVLSADGTEVAFVSTGSDLVASDANGVADVFVRDLIAGTTTLVSVNAAGTGGGNRPSTDLALSPDGTKIAFTSSATDLGPPNRGDGTRTDVYLRDLTSGQTTLLSVLPDWMGGLDGVEPSSQPVFSPRGDAVAFTSGAPLTGGGGGRTNVFLRDLTTGATSLVSTEAPAPSPARTVLFDASAPVFRPDGGAIAFEAGVMYAIGSEGYFYQDIELADLGTGAVELVSAHPVPTDPDTHSDKVARAAVFSPDGSKIAFESAAGYFGPTDANGRTDVYLRDLGTDATSLVTVRTDGSAAGGGDPTISPDGTLVAFASPYGILGPEDDPDDDGVDHVYVRDLGANQTTLVAARTEGQGTLRGYGSPLFVDGGTRLALVTDSAALGPVDSNRASDVYLATRSEIRTATPGTGRPPRRSAGRSGS